MSYYNLPDRNLEPPESNARKAFTCELCEDSIYEGEDYYDIPGVGVCCEKCIDDCKRYDAEAYDPCMDLAKEAREEGMF